MRKSAYTIIELVIAVTILAVVLVMTSNLTILVNRSKRVQSITSQMLAEQQSMSQFIARDISAIEVPSPGNTVTSRIYQTNSSMAGQILYLQRKEVGDSGIPEGAVGHYVYCVGGFVPLTAAQQLVKMTISGAVTPTLPPAPQLEGIPCSVSAIATAFSVPAAQISTRILTASEMSTSRFEVAPVWGVATSATSLLQNAPAYRVSLLFFYVGSSTDPRAANFAAEIPPASRSFITPVTSSRFSYATP